MQSLDINFLNNLSFTESQLSTLRALGECRGKQELFARQTPEVLGSLKQVALIESSESSNRLEGIVAPRDRVEGLVKKTTQPANRSEMEIAGYRDALALIHENAEHMPFTINVIKQLHTMVYRYMAEGGGNWKPADNEIVERDDQGNIIRVRFIPVSAVETPQAMGDLVENYRQAVEVQNKEPLVILPLAILDFLCIHPYRDGNGRVARLLTLHLLYHFNYRVGTYISLERIFEETKESYYDTLEASSRGWHEGRHDVNPWMDYFWGVLVRAYREFEDRVGTIRSGKGSKSEQIRAAVERKIAPFAISDIGSELPEISRDMIRVVLRQLRDEGVIEPRGKGRGAKWLKKQS